MAVEIGEVPPGAVVVHKPHGFVHLVQCRADDLMVVNSARVSFRKRSGWEYVATDGLFFNDQEEAFDHQEALDDVELGPDQLIGRDVSTRLSEDDEKVLRFLLREKHGTPFEHNYFCFHVRAPIFVFREWHRHRIGVSVNEESGRYVQLQGDFYLPDDEHVRMQMGRPGRYYFESMGDQVAEDFKEDAGEHTGWTYGELVRYNLKFAYDVAYQRYEAMLSAGIAKEVARACLPVGIYSQMYWSCNARSLMNFLSLRNHDRALAEIRDYAAAMEKLFAEKMPVTYSAFVENDRVAP